MYCKSEKVTGGGEEGEGKEEGEGEGGEGGEGEDKWLSFPYN